MVRAFYLKMRPRYAHQSVHNHEFSWIKGNVSTLLLQDFVGAAFGAMFFAVTQEIWTIAENLRIVNVIAVFIISIVMGFALVYLSRRRKMMSEKIEHAASMRVIEIYAISWLTALLFVMVFDTAGSLDLMLKQTFMIALPAVVSAATADLLFF